MNIIDKTNKNLHYNLNLLLLTFLDLLEKSRVIKQGPGERSFHVKFSFKFIQILNFSDFLSNDDFKQIEG